MKKSGTLLSGNNNFRQVAAFSSHFLMDITMLRALFLNLKIKIVRIEHEPFNRLYFSCPSLGPIGGYFVDCSPGGRYFASYHHLVDFHCHQLGSVHHLFGRSFL